MLISLPLSGVVFFLTGSVYSALGCFCSGVFIDLDHIIDYLVYSGFRFSIKGFFDACYNYRLKIFYLFMHSYEILALFWLAYFLTSNTILLGVNIGYTVHMASDQLGNLTNPFTYFLYFRFSRNFEKVFRK